MLLKEKEIILSDGRHCILRSACTEDAEDLVQYLKITSAETPYLMREPEEITLTSAQEKDFLQTMEEAKRELLLIARVDGKHAGNCSLSSCGSYKRYAHRCNIAIALYQEYCGMGLGKAMLNTVLETAAGCGYEQAELEVVTANTAAVRLYKSLGFEIYGEQPHSMKYKDGSYANEYLMVKNLTPVK
ncbi:GNAT family N-acetyltransferase [Murimonas intestini]|uniref:L-amino acid N-acyltransferase YncA n=1 Tax=Murimonas intestini TaxID=1337051 RepID=A0AB73T1Z9_9FIRM|nr:GNAT family N-acetyltransferase [Murimonas intestini]MCR1842619.1 GNAT family N-acetyltransferase [Murimonas intestini]MCR1867334.1 GNAT family N-acetyltransferase [Murimonas intestini]MCR1884521.1 GNAT family N-acetyltransferase [Murimonas intestini]